MEENIHDIRELNKMGLYLYLEEYEFPDLEKLLESAIEKLHTELENATKELAEEIKKEDNDRYSNAPSIEYERFSIQGRLWSIYEMIIVNDYKEFELILKRLLKASLDFEEKNFRSFDNLKPILKDKGIDFTEVKNYNDINDLRKVNNHIKHSKIVQIPNDLKQILEFKGEDKLSYLELMQFHKRVKDLRSGFILDLKEKIISHLYEFDENRINNIASKLLKRMDSNQINILIKKLK